jgi:excisionase family DNA binding protein
MPDLNEFITTSEAAKMLGFTEVSVRNVVYKKKLASIRFGRSLLIPKKSAKEYINRFLRPAHSRARTRILCAYWAT